MIDGLRVIGFGFSFKGFGIKQVCGALGLQWPINQKERF
jgi:hypothetical protein